MIPSQHCRTWMNCSVPSACINRIRSSRTVSPPSSISCDELRYFRPVDIYSDKIVYAQSYSLLLGLCNNLRGLAPIHIGALVNTHSSMWMSRYSGFWHAYQYALE